MGLRYLTFMGRNLKNKKKLMLVRIMNNVGMNSMNIENNVNIFSDSATTIVFLVNNVGMNNVSYEYY